MIEQGLWILESPRQPRVISNCRAALPCTCSAFIGVRVDTSECAVVAAACGPQHDHLMQHVNLLIKESLVAPTDRPLGDVVDELLTQAARAHRAAA